MIVWMLIYSHKTSLSVFYPPFIGPPETANVSHVADHIEHIANIVGKNHVGIASDFDGMYSSVKGLEDASKYPNLVCIKFDRYQCLK